MFLWRSGRLVWRRKAKDQNFVRITALQCQLLLERLVGSNIRVVGFRDHHALRRSDNEDRGDFEDMATMRRAKRNGSEDKVRTTTYT